MTSKMRRVCKIISLGILLCGASLPARATLVTGLSDIQIQNVLENYFPLNEYAASARVSLHKPQVRLQKENENIVLIIPMVAKVTGGAAHNGHVTIEVKLAYKAPTGGLYFSQPHIQQFEMPGVDKKMLAELQGIVESMAENSLPVVRIYTVKEHELNHSLSKSTLKSSVIADGRLHLEFGFK